MGIAALPHWVVESVERQGLWYQNPAMVCGACSECRRVRDGDQRQAVTEAFIRSTRSRLRSSAACERERPIFDAPTAKP